MKKAKKEFEKKLAKNIKEDRKSFLHMHEARARLKSKSGHLRIVMVTCRVKLQQKQNC